MKLNEIQEKIINSNDNLLVIAGAGCGKTKCIIEKVNILLKYIKPEEILIISFTNETVNNLKIKINKDVNIFTFHKLSINILKNNNYEYKLCNENLLKYIIDEYFISIINNTNIKKLKLYYLRFNYKKLLSSENINNLKNTIYTFIKIMQCNNYDINYLYDLYYNSKNYIIYEIIINIYKLYNYEKSSQQLLDLDDLIIIANNISKNIKFNYKYIFIDEFQDTSEIRFNLIYNIFNNSNSKINFFGDDYQSIYAFSGCKLDIMLNIQNKITDIKTIIMNENYRSDNYLIQKANKFIIKNKKQIPKKIYSNIHINNSINYIYYSNISNSFNKLIDKIKYETNDIMILSRYKHDFKDITTNYKCLTIHESKGLEADYIIILNLTNSRYGFPSKIKDNNILKPLNTLNENIKYPEERRLFYVAVTRCKKKVFLLIPFSNKSKFIKEFN